MLLRKPAFIQIAVLTLINAVIILGYTVISGAPILLAALVSLAQLPAALCLDYGVAFLLGARRHGVVSVLRVLGPSAYAIGLVVLYLTHRPSVAAVLALGTGGLVLAGIIGLVSGLRAIRPLRAKESLVEKHGATQARKLILAFGRQGYVGYLSPVDSFRIDQLVVGFLISPQALGFYVVAGAFTTLCRMIAINIGMSATPDIAARRDHFDRLRAVRHTLLLAAGVLSVFTIALGLLLIVAIPVLFGNTFRASILIAEILLVASWFLSMKRIAVDAMRGVGEARVGTTAEMVNVGIFLAACVPLGLAVGGPGVALALVISSASGSIVLVRRLRQLGLTLAPLPPLTETERARAREHTVVNFPPVEYQITALREVIVAIAARTTRLDALTLGYALTNVSRPDADARYEPLTVAACSQGIEQLVRHGDLEVMTSDLWRIVMRRITP